MNCMCIKRMHVDRRKRSIGLDSLGSSSSSVYLVLCCTWLRLPHRLLMASVDLCKDSVKDTPFKLPITPAAVTENGDFQSQSPLTLSVVRKQLKRACIDCDSESDPNGSPRTPKDGVFDPFAPGPDNMARAPSSNKYLDEYRTVARRLDFHPHADADTLSDEDMVESVYENLLQVIVSKQAEEMSDDCQTPSSMPRLTGTADTCPAAPIKPAGKPRNIELALCKKLEF
ncbi:hypothetical protein VNO78_26038 [Psophocarpus tetragonolobus]|uniref:Uncharacterized protein n=1 Tax=Psophocarpus tetragonolobus TaxID=3891 RepID=A0AAN9S1E0_PSOTE